MSDGRDPVSLLYRAARAGARPWPRGQRPRPRRSRWPWDEQPDDPREAWDEEPADPREAWDEKPNPVSSRGRKRGSAAGK